MLFVEGAYEVEGRTWGDWLARPPESFYLPCVRKDEMHLWVVNHYAGSPARGMGFRHYFLCRHLRNHGIHPTIISAAFTHLLMNPINITDDFLITEEESVSRVYIRTRSYRGNGLGRLLNTLDFARGLTKFGRRNGLPRPDLILGSSPHLSGALAAMRLAQEWGVPFYFEARDLLPLYLVDTGALPRFHPLVLHWDHVEKLLIRGADLVLSVVPFAGEHFAARGLSPGKFHYLPNGIEPPERSNEDPPLAAELRRRRLSGDFTVVYAGSHGFANNLEVVLGAAERLTHEKRNHVHLYLVGSGPRKPELQRAAAQQELTNVHFSGSLPRSQVIGALNEAGACYIGLRSAAGFRYGVSPNKLLDYMLAGRPIIYAINSGNHPVHDAACGIEIPPDSPDQLAAAIRRMADMTDQERAVMGERGRAYVFEHHRYEKLAGRLAELVFDGRITRAG